MNKIVKNLDNDENFDYDSEENLEDDYLEDDSLNEENYYLDTISLLQTHIIEYVEKHSLPICEYLYTENLYNYFINKI